MTGIAFGDAERQSILVDLARLANHRIAPDAAELVHRNQARNICAIPHHDLTGQIRSVGDDDLVAQHAVMRNMAVGHEKAAAAYSRGAAVARAAMNRDTFAQPVVIADFGAGKAVRLELEVLRVAADHRVLGDAVARADTGVALDHCMGCNFAIVADDDIPFDHGKGTDVHVGAQARVAGDDCAGVDTHVKACLIAPTICLTWASFSIGEIGSDRQRCATASATGRLTWPWLAANISWRCNGTG